jgi:hypothetical protein
LPVIASTIWTSRRSWRRLIPLAHPADSDVGEVLQPFKVGDRHAAGIGVDVGDDQDAAFLEYLLCARSRRAIRAFSDDLRPDPSGIGSSVI